MAGPSKADSRDARIQQLETEVQQLLAAQDAYQQKYNRDMGLVNGVGNAYNNLLMNAGNGNVQRGQALQQSAYGGLGGLISGGGLDGLGSMF